MKKNRWIDSLDVPNYAYSEAKYRYASLDWLNSALYYAEVGDLPMMHSCLASAGGRVMSWRRSLDDQGERLEIDPVVPASPSYYIGECIRTLTWDVEAENLRFVEAILRYIWEESQR